MDCIVSVDGTDFHIKDPWTFHESNKDYYLYKLNEICLRYEVGISIIKGDILCINGPYECGKWTEINIFRDSLIHYLDNNERVESDKFYSVGSNEM